MVTHSEIKEVDLNPLIITNDNQVLTVDIRIKL
jgi:succinyl-CoA synthetase beta subunit